MAEKVKERCSCAISVIALDDTLRSIRSIIKERGLPREDWLRLLRSNLEKAERDCGITLDRVEGDVREAEKRHKEADVRGLLGAIETARTQLTLSILKCEKGEEG